MCLLESDVYTLYASRHHPFSVYSLIKSCHSHHMLVHRRASYLSAADDIKISFGTKSLKVFVQLDLVFCRTYFQNFPQLHPFYKIIWYQSGGIYANIHICCMAPGQHYALPWLNIEPTYLSSFESCVLPALLHSIVSENIFWSNWKEHINLTMQAENIFWKWTGAKMTE